ncbi:MAG TPA: Ig-like domain-containing protein [Anaerolineae bacterium]|nr:Ig-like domain-containing protein [Anaerolineae bacterium]
MRNLKRWLSSFTLIVVLATISLQQDYDPVGAAPPQQSPIVISDDDFDPGDWTVAVDIFGSPTTQTGQRAGGGNPAAYRYTQDTFPAMAQYDFYSVTTFHWFQGATYDPATQGAFDHLDYREDHILLSATPAHASPEVDGYIIIQQDGEIYSPFTHSFINTSGWQTYSLTGLQATDFHRFTHPVEGVHPDFSTAGSPITFGYARYRDRYSGDPADVPVNQELVYEHGIDNWMVTINQAGGNSPPVAVDDYFVAETFGGPTVTDQFHLFKNDYDPDGDPLVLESFTQPTYGSVENPFGDLIVYTRTGGGPPDSFSYTLSSPAANSIGASAIGAVAWFIPDCGCVIGCLDQPSAVGSAATTSSLDLALIYRLRDNVMKPTTDGNRYVKMYYDTTPEIIKILILDQPSLGDEAVAVVELWQDNLYSLVDGDGNALVTQAQVNAIKTFLANLSAAGSAGLQQLIADELARLGPLDDYVGLSVKAAKSKAIGNPAIYLPLIIK